MATIPNRRSVMTLFSRPTDIHSHRTRLVLAEKNINIEDMTTSSYAAAHTGTPMFSVRMSIGIPADIHIAALRDEFPEGRYDLVYQTPAFYRGTYHLLRDGELIKLEIPEDASPQGIFKGQMLVSLRTDWETGGKGDLIVNLNGEKLGLWNGFFVNIHHEIVAGNDLNQFVSI